MAANIYFYVRYRQKRLSLNIGTFELVNPPGWSIVVFMRVVHDVHKIMLGTILVLVYW